MLELLKKLVSIPAACGHEHEISKFMLEYMKDKVDECYIDGLGNVIVKKQGKNKGPVLMLSAHADEVGFIVKKIEESGLIRFEKLGGHDDRVILCQQVVVSTKNGPLTGIIGTISCHMMKYDDPNLVRKHSSLYIDIGAKDKAEAIEMGVSIGDPITWLNEVKPLGKNRIVGHGFDDKAGCALLAKAIEEIDFNNVCGTVYGVFSVQEEVGLRGAHTASNQIQPDIAIAIDTTACSDTPENMMDNTVGLGRGAGIKVMDFSLISSVSLRKKLQAVAEENNIEYQLEVFPGIGTDAGEMHKAGSGVPTGVISIPSRYAHSPNEVIDLGDYEYSKELLKAFILDMKEGDGYPFVN